MSIEKLLRETAVAAKQLVALSDEQVVKILRQVADALDAHLAEVLAANAEDLQRMDPANPKYDRLKLTADRVAAIANDMRNVASLPSPLGRVL